MTHSDFVGFFRSATGGDQAFPYQVEFATAPDLPELVTVPTGAGKTATAVLGWLWRRRLHADAAVRAATPRRLVFCLPMRALVEQTHAATSRWLDALGLRNHVGLHMLLGGAVDEAWEAFPERDAVLVGTQDQLLSRALCRGYGMSRYRWPMHFALLNNDCLWLLDEVQLMGVGSSTSAQLQAFREHYGAVGPTASIWMTATLAAGRLDTVDRRGHVPRRLSLTSADLDSSELAARCRAPKPIARASASLALGDTRAMADEICAAHIENSLTLVVVNRVARAQSLFVALQRAARGLSVRLLHSRFRPHERQRLQREVLAPHWSGILVATQAIEAGVDTSARTLFTELAAWSSMVQRFGRCNRRGEFSIDQASVRWMEVDDGDAAPYTAEEFAEARAHLAVLRDVGPASLVDRSPSDQRPVPPVIRRRDLLDLFDTEPDLAGHDLDVSRYVRDSDERDVQVAWRDVPPEGPTPEEPDLHRDELCTVGIGALSKFLKSRSGFRWSGLTARWDAVLTPVPGMVILLPRALGGYSVELGWTGDARDVLSKEDTRANSPRAPDADDREPLSWACDAYVTLKDHADDVAAEAASLRIALAGDGPWESIERAARWHDLGKVHPVFQDMLTHGLPPEDPRRLAGPWAKSDGSVRARSSRPHFRHELASALALLAEGGSDLEAYLVAAHHGKVRVSIRSRPGEKEPHEKGRRFAFGIWDGDELPSADLGSGVRCGAVRLDLEPMGIGDGPAGPSWLTRTKSLLAEHGPFQLAFWEMIVRVADWRGTARRRAQPLLEAP